MNGWLSTKASSHQYDNKAFNQNVSLVIRIYIVQKLLKANTAILLVSTVKIDGRVIDLCWNKIQKVSTVYKKKYFDYLCCSLVELVNFTDDFDDRTSAFIHISGRGINKAILLAKSIMFVSKRKQTKQQVVAIRRCFTSSAYKQGNHILLYKRVSKVDMALRISTKTLGSSMVEGNTTNSLFAKSAIALRIVLPDRVRGSDLTGAINRNDAMGPTTSRIFCIISADNLVVDLRYFSLGTYRQRGTCPLVGSLTPNTAASTTSGCRRTASSSDRVDIR
ncbi:hypothetical protein DOY81_002959 [Sarcophaga bullata]|nr:hypothetical protein DOY81_002959 [Sarcophaga bullata]